MTSLRAETKLNVDVKLSGEGARSTVKPDYSESKGPIELMVEENEGFHLVVNKKKERQSEIRNVRQEQSQRDRDEAYEQQKAAWEKRRRERERRRHRGARKGNGKKDTSIEKLEDQFEQLTTANEEIIVPAPIPAVNPWKITTIAPQVENPHGESGIKAEIEEQVLDNFSGIEKTKKDIEIQTSKIASMSSKNPWIKKPETLALEKELNRSEEAKKQDKKEEGLKMENQGGELKKNEFEAQKNELVQESEDNFMGNIPSYHSVRSYSSVLQQSENANRALKKKEMNGWGSVSEEVPQSSTSMTSDWPVLSGKVTGNGCGKALKAPPLPEQEQPKQIPKVQPRHREREDGYFPERRKWSDDRRNRRGDERRTRVLPPRKGRKEWKEKEEYTDYPPEFTTLVPLLSPVQYPEYIMPYAVPTEAPVFFAPMLHPLTAQVFNIQSEAILLNVLRNQIEYYFSKENLEKDFFLRRKMDSEGFLPVGLIASFWRMRQLTDNYGHILSAIADSPDLELKDGRFVRTVHGPRNWPIQDGASAVLSPPPANEVFNPEVPEFVPSENGQREVDRASSGSPPPFIFSSLSSSQSDY